MRSKSTGTVCPTVAALNRSCWLFENILQPRQPLRLQSFGHLVVHVGGGRAGAGGILERVGLREADGFHQLQGFVEILVGLAGEADDHIGRKGDVGSRCTNALDRAKVIFRGVFAIHGGENAIRARLHRQMQVGHELGHFRMSDDEIIAHVARMARHVADALQAIDAGKTTDQPGKRCLARLFQRRHGRH